MTKFSFFGAAAVAAMLTVAPIAATPALADGHCDAKAVKTGEKQFRKCKACHKLEDGKNGVGPHLAGIVGRGVADVDGYKYSSAMAAYGEDAA